MNSNMEEEKYHEEVILSPEVTKPVEDTTKERLIDNGRKRVLKTFLTLGPSRVGKSSFINALAGKPICIVGKSSGSQQSTTT
jgi:ribosome biogenesis GTPase A